MPINEKNQLSPRIQFKIKTEVVRTLLSACPEHSCKTTQLMILILILLPRFYIMANHLLNKGTLLSGCPEAGVLVRKLSQLIPLS